MRDKSLNPSPGASILLLVLPIVSLIGCRAGFPPPRDQSRVESDRQAAYIFDRRLSAGELRHELSYTEGGRVLQKALHVHGGWDLWRELVQVEYERQRTWAQLKTSGAQLQLFATNGAELKTDGSLTEEGDHGGEAGGSGESESEAAIPVATTESRRYDFDLENWQKPPGEEEWLFSLPFRLVWPEYTKEYLGVEWDVRQQIEFKKIEFVRSKPVDGQPEIVVAYFDAESGLLKQVLQSRPSGDWLLVRFYGWRSIAGLRLPTRREFYGIEGRFRRAREDKLVWKDKLEEIEIR